MPLPVVTVASGGLPVAEAAAGKPGFPVVEATNKFGLAVTKVTNGFGWAVAYAGGGAAVPYPPPDLVAWPDATNTGVPAGTSLAPSSGDFTTTADGQTIDSKSVSAGTIIIDHNNVTVQRCKVVTTGSYAVRVMPGKTGAVIRDCDLSGAQNGVFGGGMTVQRCNIYGIENGVTVSGGSNVVILDNYMHDFFQPVDPHYDGVAAQGGCNNVTIQHNRIDIGFAQSSCVFLTDEFGAATNLKVLNNWMTGAGYNISCGAAGLTAVVVQNNLFGMGAAGFYNFATPAGQMTVSGNVSTTGIYLDGDVPPLVGTLAFAPSNAITSASDQNNTTGFRVAATLVQAIAAQFRLVLYSGATGAMGLESVVFGKQSSGQTATAVLAPVLFGGAPAPLGPNIPTLHYVVSDWMAPGLSFAAGNVMLVGFALRNPGGTGLANSNTNATSFFGTPANVAQANPAYAAAAGTCFALARIETR